MERQKVATPKKALNFQNPGKNQGYEKRERESKKVIPEGFPRKR